MTEPQSFWDDLLAILRLGANTAKSVLQRYWIFLRRWERKVVTAGVILSVLLMAIGVGNGGPAWVLSLGALALGLLGVVAILPAIPLLFAITALQEFDQARKILNWIVLAAFGAIMFAIASQVLPLWQNPEKLLLLLLLISGAVLGARLGLVLIPKAYLARVLTLLLVVLFLFAILSLAVPNSLNWIRNSLGMSEVLPSSLVIDLDAETPIRDPKSGKQVAWTRIWFIRRPGNAFELFDRAGLDPRTGTALEYLDTEDERVAIVKWIQDLRDKEHIRIQQKKDSITASVVQAKKTADSLDDGRKQFLDDSLRRADSIVGALATEQAKQAHDDSVARIGAARVAAQAHRDSLIAETKAVEALASVASARPFKGRPEWAEELTGKSLTIEFSPISRRLAAALLRRLRTIQVETTLAPVLAGTQVNAPTIEYTQAELHAAEAVNALLGDLARFDLNSFRSSRPLRILLP